MKLQTAEQEVSTPHGLHAVLLFFKYKFTARNLFLFIYHKWIFFFPYKDHQKHPEVHMTCGYIVSLSEDQQ